MQTRAPDDVTSEVAQVEFEEGAAAFSMLLHLRGELPRDIYGDALNPRQTRVRSILTHQAATGREGLARSLAFGTNLSPAQAVEALNAGPVSEFEAGAAAARALGLGRSSDRSRRA